MQQRLGSSNTVIARCLTTREVFHITVTFVCSYCWRTARFSSLYVQDVWAVEWKRSWPLHDIFRLKMGMCRCAKKLFILKPIPWNSPVQCFDAKPNRPQRLQADKFALFSEVWNHLINNCCARYKCGALSVIEQFFPTKDQLPFRPVSGIKVRLVWAMMLDSCGQEKQQIPDKRFSLCWERMKHAPWMSSFWSRSDSAHWTFNWIKEEMCAKVTTLTVHREKAWTSMCWYLAKYARILQ